LPERWIGGSCTKSYGANLVKVFRFPIWVKGAFCVRKRGQVSVDSSVDPERTGLNDVVIPRVRQLPGVIAGHWLEPIDGKGLSIVIFETHEAARGAIEAMGLKEGSSPAPGVTVEGVQTREVIGHL
jgi:hypothetical protein